LPPTPPADRERGLLVRLVLLILDLHAHFLDFLFNLAALSELLLKILDAVLSGLQSFTETFDLSLQVVGSVTVLEGVTDVFTSRYAILVGLLVEIVEEVLSQSDGDVLHGELNTR
jgi:hypothetical protein